MNLYFDHQSFSCSPVENLLKLLDFRRLWALTAKRADSRYMIRSRFRSKYGTVDDLRNYFFANIDKLKHDIGESKVGTLTQMFTHLFDGKVCRGDPLLVSSANGELCVGIECGMRPLRTIKGCYEAVSVTSVTHLTDDCVNRVLYCNCPDNPENQCCKGFLSVNHNMKHFGAKGKKWVQATARNGGGKDGDYAKFLPSIKFLSAEYECLLIRSLLDAFRSGCFSEQRINKYLFDSGSIIGASAGEEVSVVKIYFCQGNIHLRPYSARERS